MSQRPFVFRFVARVPEMKPAATDTPIDAAAMERRKYNAERGLGRIEEDTNRRKSAGGVPQLLTGNIRC